MKSDLHKNVGASRIQRLSAWLFLPLTLAVLAFVALIPMTWQQQAFFGVLVVVAAFLIDRSKRGPAATILLVLLCLCATTRYGYWRSATLWEYLHRPWAHVSAVGAVLMLILVGAEFYTFLILVLGFFQTIAPLRRPPLLMPENSENWPVVDVLIPTLHESLDVVRYTVLAALQMDWPAEKLNVILLDDGGRNEFREFAKQAGVRYIARTEHSHAKAGNLNNALRHSSGEFVTIFDCDHVPTRSFLQISIGWFLRDARLAMLQTPHHFYSPDPLERNLGKFRKVPSEGSLFYGIVQDANDLWNATFFCGSCAVLRRSSLDSVGGIAQETVTEDAHTSLRLQKAGWNTAYINLPQAAGLATETLARHVKQRIRWARGMVQILRIDNPLFARRANTFSAALLLQCDPAFPLCFAAPDLPHRATAVSVLRPLQRSWILAGHSGLCRPAFGSFHDRKFAYPGQQALLFLERDLRDRFIALHPSAYFLRPDQPEERQVQRHRQRGRAGERVLQPQAVGSVSLFAGAQSGWPGAGNSALSLLGPGAQRHHRDERILGILQRGHSRGGFVGLRGGAAKEARGARSLCGSGHSSGARRSHRGNHGRPLNQWPGGGGWSVVAVGRGSAHRVSGRGIRRAFAGQRSRCE